jgi:rhodanese-related sulfurtransferase
MTARRVLVVIAVVCAVSAALLGSSTPNGTHVTMRALAEQIEREDDHVTGLELAEWIRARKPGLRVIDVRSDSEYAEYHIPSAERIALADVPKLAPVNDETLVLYSGGGAHAAQAWVLLKASGHDRVYFLRGGLLEWMDDVMNPVLPATADSLSRKTSELSRYFGGVPRVGTVPLPTSNVRQSGTASAVARLRRRGC